MPSTFAVVDAPGFENGDAEMRIYSTYENAPLAEKEARRHDYIEAGTHHHMKPRGVIEVFESVEAGDVVWNDTCGRTAWKWV